MPETSVVADGTVVTMHYTLKDSEGTVLDTSSGAEPLAYLHGADNIVPGLERELAGKSVGEKVNAVVPPELGYGERHSDGVQKISRDAFPEDAQLAAGMQVVAQGPNGQAFPLWIVAADDEHVTVDANHPLAGTTLHFEVEITALRAATTEEKEHGHPHGPGGHEH
jgi:FKBP-type peptidyl-prolyl cis-trans isomerase SlyD